jgi:ElaB/YqjD/DUF883 family membrane-anchored ribosome-binding protein
MEVYYKDLISEEASLEKLVDSLMLVVQGADEYAEVAGASLPQEQREELTTRLQRLKERCRQIKEQTVAGAQAANRVVRHYPYSAAGFAFAFGLLVGHLVRRRS